eukprot:6596269-Prymnesium_polylepis.1
MSAPSGGTVPPAPRDRQAAQLQRRRRSGLHYRARPCCYHHRGWRWRRQWHWRWRWRWRRWRCWRCAGTARLSGREQ